jgi:hypothetical protein
LDGKNGRGVGEAVLALLSNRSKFVKVSEPVPTGTTGPVIHVVGSTHSAFALNSSADSVLLYVSSNTENTQRWIKVFTEAAIQNPFPSVAFGILNVTLNALNFPELPSLPHIEIYPIQEKVQLGRMYFGRVSSTSILSFIGRYVTGVTDPRETDRDRICEILQILKFKDTLSPNKRQRAEERLTELHTLVDFVPISDEL